MYNLAGFLCNYWIFPVGQSVSPILCLSWPYQCWYWSTVHTTITGLPHLLWLFLLCTTDQMMSVPVPAWLLPGCCLYPSLPSPRTLLGLTWGDATLRVLIRISWLTVKTLSLHSTTSLAWVSLTIMRDLQPPRLPRLPPEMWIRVLRRLEIQDLCNVALVGPFILYFSQWGLERSVGKYN